ncbi:unnamed protein product [Mucor hiemalis]
MLSFIKNNFFVLAFILALTQLAFAAQVCRVCLNNSIVKFELWSNVDGRLIDQASVSSNCGNSVSATGRFQYRALENVASVSGLEFNNKCNLGAGNGDNTKWTQCCNIAYNG